jgi:tetratricopeptide (TPR) repeat protein
MTTRDAIKKLCLVVTPVFFLAVFLTSASAQTGENGFAPIASALQNKEFHNALELLRPALQAAPGNAELWAMQGAAYAGEGHSKEALDSFGHALKIAPNYLPALQGAIQIDYEAGNPAAIPLLQRVLRARPADRTSHGMLAVLEYQQGNYAVAADHFEKAGSLFDSQPTALHAYAVCLVKLKQFDQAATIFQRSVALQPGDVRERRLLASIQLMAKKPTEALATLQPLLHSNSPDAETLDLAAKAYEDSKDTPQAVATLRQAILLDPQNVNLYVDFADISSTHASAQVGIDVVTGGISLLPKSAPLYLARGVLYVQVAEYDKAEADFETAHELDPRQTISSASQGLLAAEENDLDRALATVQAKLVQNPKDPGLLYLQADFLTQRGVEPDTADFQLALRSAKEAVSLKPQLSGARTILAKLYLQAGNYSEAAEECRKALASDPKDQAAVYHLIQALRKTGDQREIPDLLKRFALLREQAGREQNDRYRYKLVEDEAQPKPPAQP